MQLELQLVLSKQKLGDAVNAAYDFGGQKLADKMMEAIQFDAI